MSQKSSKRGVTLVELVLAILLVNVVILTGLSMEMGMRKLFSGSDFSTELNSEAATIMTFVAKNINRAIGAQALGGAYLPYSTVGAAGWSFLQDTNSNGAPDPGLDIRCAFRFFNANGQLCYYTDVTNINGAPTIVLTTHCTQFSISDPAGVGYSTIRLGLKRNISAAVNATNPALNFITKAQYLGASFN